MTLAITSEDCTVVPIRWECDGAASCGKRCPFAWYWLNAYGEMTDANSASTMKKRVIAAPVQSIALAKPRASRMGLSARPTAGRKRSRPA